MSSCLMLYELTFLLRHFPLFWRSSSEKPIGVSQAEFWRSALREVYENVSLSIGK